MKLLQLTFCIPLLLSSAIACGEDSASDDASSSDDGNSDADDADEADDEADDADEADASSGASKDDAGVAADGGEDDATPDEAESGDAGASGGEQATEGDAAVDEAPQDDEDEVSQGDAAAGGGSVAESGAAMIGPEGGEIQAGAATITFPEGAVEDDIEITWSVVSEEDQPDNERVVSQVIEFGPDGLELLEAATLEFAYNADAAEGLELAVAWYDEDAGAWVPLGDSVQAGDSVVATTDHFTLFSVVALEQAGLGNDYSAMCEESCVATGGLDCPADGSLEECVAECEQSLQLLDLASCGEEYLAFANCAGTDVEANFECGEDGESGLKSGVCDDELLVLLTCASDSQQPDASAFEADCKASCASVPLACDGEVPDPDCETNCGLTMLAIEECGPLWLEAVNCAYASPDNWSCVDGVSEFDEQICLDDYDAFSECMAASEAQ